MARFIISSLAVIGTMACGNPAYAQQDVPQDYSDGVRGVVTLPQGDKSFADAVVAYTPGSGTIVDSARDPLALLGPPSFSGDVDDGSFVSLGCDGSIVVQFTDNALVDVAGPDLYVFEVGPNVEGMSLAVSEDGTTWIEIGDIGGGRAEVDLAGLVPDGASFRFVRLTDDGVDCGTRFAGADIDAVAAIGSTLRFVLDGAVLFEVDSTELRPEAQEALTDLAQDISAAGLTRFRVVGHTDSTGSDAYNLDLSQGRALSVRDFLATLPALSGVEISAEGRGEAEPIADNDTAEGRSLNRRVEIIGN
ncbi:MULTISPECIES: OmpA family protein [unclassified Yoonia]|uniref:OmpA family protein n=1 Tax=unclassified Yoonia TaxID=2629118 RepID=UPI002B00117E|nr:MULTISPECIES: OmpA family protein [unclassified Yoonia]